VPWQTNTENKFKRLQIYHTDWWKRRQNFQKQCIISTWNEQLSVSVRVSLTLTTN